MEPAVMFLFIFLTLQKYDFSNELSLSVRQISLSTPKSPKWDFQKVLFLGPLGVGVNQEKELFGFWEFCRTPLPFQILIVHLELKF